MSLPVVTRPAAASEIETAYRWYEKEREGLGSEFLDAVEKIVKVIAENPERFPAIRNDIRRAVLRRFPYSIFYRIVSAIREKLFRNWSDNSVPTDHAPLGTMLHIFPPTGLVDL